MTLSSTELSVLLEFLPLLLSFSYFFFFLSFLAKDCQGKKLHLVTLVSTSRELENLVASLQTVVATVTYNGLLWCSGLFLCGAFFLPALAPSISHFCLGSVVFCFLPITLLELKKKNHRNIVSQRLL